MNVDLVPITNKADTQEFMKAVAWQYEDDLINAFALAKADAEQKTFRDMRSFLEGSLDPDSNHLFFVRDSDKSEYVGAVWLVTEADVRIAWLCYILIYPRFRRNGYGAEAIRRVHEKARELGCDQINLYVHCHNGLAHTLYRKMGYTHSSFFMRMAL
jgi:GNAT superfamily N-acetyltransferase